MRPTQNPGNNRIEQREDGSRWMEIQVGSHMEWRETATKTERYKYLESPAEYRITWEKPTLKDGEQLFRCCDGRLAILPPMPAALEVVP